jgi:hypothetical protein
MKLAYLFIASCAVLSASTGHSAVNIAEGKTVTATGTFGSSLPIAPPTADPATIVDGAFLPSPSKTFWYEGSVWWNSSKYENDIDNNIVINLGASI